MPAKQAPGTIKLDKVSYQLIQTDRGGYTFERRDIASPAPISTPEEPLLTRHNPSYLRTIGQMDWSKGIGLSQYEPNDARMSWSQGPSGENLRQIHRAHEVRRTPLGHDGAVTDFFSIAGNQYVVCGDYIRRIQPTLNEETILPAKAVTGVGDVDGIYITDRAFTEASPLWWDSTSTRVFIGANGGQVVTFNGSTWNIANTTPASNYTRWTLGVYQDGTASQRLWAAGPASGDANGIWVRNLPVGQNPLVDGQWSVRFPFGNRAASITALAALRNSIIITTSDGMVYRLSYEDTGGVPTPLTDFRSAIANSTAGIGTRIWNGVPVVPLARGLQVYVEDNNGGGQWHSVGPEDAPGSNNPVRGQVTALCTADPEWLYAAFYNPSDPSNNGLPTSYIYKARQPHRSEQNTTALIWHPACHRIVNERVTAMDICTLGTNPILMIGTNLPAMHFVTLPRFGQNALSDNNCRSTITPHYCELPLHDALSPNVTKTFRRIRLSVRDLTELEYVKVYYAIDSSDFTPAETVASESPFVNILLPPNTQGRAIAIRLEFAGTDPFAFPTVESVAVDFTAKSDITSYVDVQVFIERSQMTFSGLAVKGTRNRLAYLYRLVTEEAPIVAIGPDGQSIQAQLDGAAGLTVKAVTHTNYSQEPGFVCAFRINLYEELTPRSPAQWDVSPWTEGTNKSYWGT